MEFDSIIVNRLPIRELSVKLRSAGQTALELLQRKRHLQISAILLCDLMDLNGDDDASSDDEIEEEEDDLKNFDALGYAYAHKVSQCDAPRRVTVRRIVRKEVTLDNYSDHECWNLLRFRKSDILKLILNLKLPGYLVSSDRHRFTAEFSIILFLRRMAYPGRLTDLEEEFGRDYTTLSRSFKTTLAWIDSNHSFRINNYLHFWLPYQQIFANAVASKTEVPELYFNVNSFLDGTQRPTTRPSDGPGRHEDAQRLFYSGYYR